MEFIDANKNASKYPIVLHVFSVKKNMRFKTEKVTDKIKLIPELVDYRKKPKFVYLFFGLLVK